MVADSGTAPHPGGIRPLDAPQPVQVEVDGNDMPIAIAAVKGRNAGASRSYKRRRVVEVLDVWRIDDEWWRKQPVSRIYYRVALEDGTITGLFKDLVSGQWRRQRA